MPPRAKANAQSTGPPPEPRKTTRQAAKLATARIAASVQELESVQDDEALTPPVKRRAGDTEEGSSRSKRTRTTSPPKLVPAAYPPQPMSAGYMPQRMPSMNYERGLAPASSAGIRLPLPPISQVQQPRSSYSGQQYPGYGEGYPQSHGGSSIQVNTHVNIYPPLLQDHSQLPPSLHDQQRADYYAYDSRPPPPYNASQPRSDPAQNMPARMPMHQNRSDYAFFDGNQRRVDPLAAGHAGYQYYDDRQFWPQAQPGQNSRSQQPRPFQDSPVDQSNVYPHQGYSANISQGLPNSQVMRKESKGYIDQQQYAMGSHGQTIRRESHSYIQSNTPYPNNGQPMRRDSQNYTDHHQFQSTAQYAQGMGPSGSRVPPSPSDYTVPSQMSFPNYSRSNSISSGSNLQSTPSPMQSYDPVRAAAGYGQPPSVPSQGGTPTVPNSFDQPCFPYPYDEGEDLTRVYSSMPDDVLTRLDAIEQGLQILTTSEKRAVFESQPFSDYSGAQKGGNIVLEDVREYCLRKVQKQHTDLRAELKAVESVNHQIQSTDHLY